MSTVVTAQTPGAITDATGLVVAVVNNGNVTVTPHGVSTGYSVAPGTVFIPAIDAFVDTETGIVTPSSKRTGFLSAIGQTEIVIGLGLLALLVWRMTR